jgi:hypothetical protein
MPNPFQRQQFRKTTSGRIPGDQVIGQMTEAFPWDMAPRYLLRDRDASYGQTFRDRVEAMAIKEVVTAARSPWQNPYVERVIGSIRRECLNHIIILNECHLRGVLCHHIFSIITRPGRISRSTRIVRTPGSTPTCCGQDHRVPRGRRTASSLRTPRHLSSHRDDPGRPVRPESWFRSATNPLDAIAPSTRARRLGPDSASSIGPMQNPQLRFFQW